MRAVIQRVSKSSVTIDGKITGETKQGLVVLLGVKNGDEESTAAYLASCGRGH